MTRIGDVTFQVAIYQKISRCISGLNWTNFVVPKGRFRTEIFISMYFCASQSEMQTLAGNQIWKVKRFKMFLIIRLTSLLSHSLRMFSKCLGLCLCLCLFVGQVMSPHQQWSLWWCVSRVTCISECPMIVFFNNGCQSVSQWQGNL